MSEQISELIPNTIKQIMADILDVDADSISDDTSMEKVASWDSSNHISLVLAIEEEYGISLEVAEIEEMRSFFDIVTTVEQKI